MLCKLCKIILIGKRSRNFCSISCSNKSRIGRIISEETKRKLSISGFGRRHSFETRKKISIGNAGKVLTKESRERMSIARKKVISREGFVQYNRGIPCPDWIKERVSKANSGRTPSLETRIKLSIAGRKRKQSESAKKKLSEDRKGKKRPEHVARILRENANTKENKERMRQQSYNRSKRHPSKPEIRMMEILRKNGINFLHQFFPKIKNYYPADFYLPEKNLIIEVDGKYYHNYPDGTTIDRIRNEQMFQSGYKVLRLWDDEITEEIVLQRIKEV